MKLKIKLNISASSFYNFLIESLKKEQNVKKLKKVWYLRKV